MLQMLQQYTAPPLPPMFYHHHVNYHHHPTMITSDQVQMMMYSIYQLYPTCSLVPMMMNYPDQEKVMNEVEDEGRHNKVTVFQENRKSYANELDPRVKFYTWSKAPAPFSILNADGSLKKDQAGIGGIIRDGEGKPLVAFSSKSKCKNSDVPVYLVELIAIRRGLREAFYHGVKNIVINSDSSLAVDYITGRTTSCFQNNAVRECIEDIKNMLKKYFKLWDCKHVFRETNRAADFLSTFIEDDDQVVDVVLYPNEFPKKLKEIVNDDASGRLYLRVKSMNVF